MLASLFRNPIDSRICLKFFRCSGSCCSVISSEACSMTVESLPSLGKESPSEEEEEGWATVVDAMAAADECSFWLLEK